MGKSIMMGNITGKYKVEGRKMSLLRNIREWTKTKTAKQLFKLSLDKDNFSKLASIFNLQSSSKGTKRERFNESV